MEPPIDVSHGLYGQLVGLPFNPFGSPAVMLAMDSQNERQGERWRQLVLGCTESRIAVIGDVMLDRYIIGTVERISPEAPVPIVRFVDEHIRPGGAANVHANLLAVGAQSVLVGLIGTGPVGQQFVDCLEKLKPSSTRLVQDKNLTTTLKTRILSNGQQLMRVDRDGDGSLLDPTVEQLFLETTHKAIDDSACLLLSDYGKGALTPSRLRSIIDHALSRSIPILVDPKGMDFSRYRGATVLTPNREEVKRVTGKEIVGDESAVTLGREIIEKAGVQSVLLTRSEDGVSYVSPDRVVHIPAQERFVFDVTGAGDTVAALFCACLAQGAQPEDAAGLANFAASLSIAHAGAYAITHQELLQRLSLQTPNEDGSAWYEVIAQWRKENLTIGFTNGCFDLIHQGHLSLLEQAKAACDRLIIGLNSDSSIGRLKGPTRPVQDLASRTNLLSALACVDLVIPFDEDTPELLVQAVQPDVLVKGGDYQEADIAGASFVRNHGGNVMIVPIIEGHSTTDLFQRIAKRSR